jgi:acyl dehydratase
MSTTAPAFNTESIGEWSDPVEFAVTRERIQQYAAATNDPIAPHVAGDLAPPVFAVVPAFQAAGAAAMKVIPPELMMMVLHGEQDFHFHAPILPNTTVFTKAAAIGMQPRSSGVTVVAKTETHDGDGKLLNEQYWTTFVRGGQAPEGVGEGAPGHALDESLRGREPDATVTQTFDKDQTFRYAEASGDPMPIHLDDDLAKAMGLPGIIIHGLCTMAFTSVAVIQSECPDDPARLTRLAVRFAKTIQPEQTITTRIWRAGDGAYAYETTSDEGAVVIKDGRAEVTVNGDGMSPTAIESAGRTPARGD